MTTRHATATPAADAGTHLPAGDPAATPSSPGPQPAAPQGASMDAATATATVTGAKTFREGVNALMAAFALFLRTPTADFTRRGKVSARRVGVTAMLVGILRDFPSVSTLSPEVVTADAAAADALDLVASLLQGVLIQVQDTVRMQRSEIWFQLHAVIAAAEHQARTDSALAARLVPVKAALAVGKRSATAAATAAAAALQATQAQDRTALAQHRATAASQAHGRATAAHAANKQVRGGVLPALNPQGPSASVEASGVSPVNPQGPAPGR